MAGDVPVDERALITPTDPAGGRSLRTALAGAGVSDPADSDHPASGDEAPTVTGSEWILHRYGQVQVLGRPRSDAPDGAGLLAARTGAGLLPPADGNVVSTTGVSPGLNRAETLGLDAFRLRAPAPPTAGSSRTAPVTAIHGTWTGPAPTSRRREDPPGRIPTTRPRSPPPTAGPAGRAH